MKIIYMPVPENYEIKYDHIIFRYNDILCLKASELNDISGPYRLIFYDINKRIYFDYCDIKKVTDRYEFEDWDYVEESHMFYILAIEEQTRQSTVIEINMKDGSCIEKAIDISSSDIIDGYYYLVYNGEEMYICNYNLQTETYSFYNYNNNTNRLNIRDISITGDIRGFCNICKYENRIVIKLEGENIKIFDENMCYISFEKRLALFLDICIDEKSIDIINDKELNKDIYFEDRVLNGGKLIFSENPYKEENVSGLERYYCYDIKNKRLEELNIRNKYMACFYENHDKDLYLATPGDDSEILRLSDMKIISKKEILNSIRELDEEILKHMGPPLDGEKWFDDNPATWWYHTCFVELGGYDYQKLLIEVDTMKAYFLLYGLNELIGIIDDTIYTFETSSEED